MKELLYITFVIQLIFGNSTNDKWSLVVIAGIIVISNSIEELAKAIKNKK